MFFQSEVGFAQHSFITKKKKQPIFFPSPKRSTTNSD